MKCRFGLVCVLLVLLGALLRDAQAQAVAVSMRLDTNVIAVGTTTFLHIEARILPAFRSSSDRIFSWYVDVLNTNGTVASANYSAMQKTASDQDPLTSSTGTADGANRRGIYDTFLNLAGAGRDTPVELMRLPITGLVAGQTRFRVQAGSSVPQLSADFLVAPTNGGDPLIGGDYGSAYVDLQVIGGAMTQPILSITQVSLGNGRYQVTIRYAVVQGLDYFVEYQNLLAASSGWQAFPGGPFNSGVYTDPVATPDRFYRMRVVPHSGGGLGAFRVDLGTTTTPGQGRLVYPVIAGYNYTIEYNDSLGAGTWQILPGAPHNSGNVIVSLAVPHRFYRVGAAPAK